MRKAIYGSFLVAAFAIDPTLSEDEIQELWQGFKETHNRDYDAEEDKTRYKYFTTNVHRIEDLNRKDGNHISYTHLSPFADWSETEFDNYQKLNVRKKDLVAHRKKMNLRTNYGDDVLPSAFDWREKGAVQEVKNQAQCGSCWAFSTIANIESVAFSELGVNMSLSEQQLVDCDSNDNACNGGLPERSDEYLISHKMGLETEKDYPYEGEEDTCRVDIKREHIWVGDVLHISMNEDDMARALMKHGALSIGINAAMMQLYGGGISQPSVDDCDPEALDHGVNIVGFGEEATPDGAKVKAARLLRQPIDFSDTAKTKYWIIRNSWGPDWGEKGYYRIIRGVGACGLNQLVTTATGITQTKPGSAQMEQLPKEIYV